MLMVSSWVHGVCLIIFCFSSPVLTYSCKSLNGNNVDWFFAYKLPVVETDRSGGYSSEGTAFLYADSTSNAWVMSQQSISSEDSAIGMTIKQIFKSSKQNDFYALYNDEHPNNKTDSGRGHMKGSFLFDDFDGFWLIHSVPNFPSTATGSYFYPHSGKRNGQSFLCVTFPTAALNEIGKQLLFGTPSVYESQLPSSFKKLYPNLALAMNGKSLPRKAQNYSSVMKIDSAAGRPFISFSKHKKFAHDLYSDFVAPELKTSLYVETWLNGAGDLPSECDSSYKVYNLRSVRPYTYDFKNSKDHSKWAVSTDPSNPWICIGDINRQKSQKGRGGGTMCLQDSRISALYRLSIGDVECCDNSSLSTSKESNKSTVWGFVKSLLSGNKSTERPSATESISRNEPKNCVIHSTKKREIKKRHKKHTNTTPKSL